MPKSPFTAATAPCAAAIWLVRAQPGKVPRASATSIVTGYEGSTLSDRISSGPTESWLRESVTPGTTVWTVVVYLVVPRAIGATSPEVAAAAMTASPAPNAFRVIRFCHIPSVSAVGSPKLESRDARVVRANHAGLPQTRDT